MMSWKVLLLFLISALSFVVGIFGLVFVCKIYDGFFKSITAVAFPLYFIFLGVYIIGICLDKIKGV